MPPSNPRFSSQDCWLTQPCPTLIYMRTLQYWIEKAQLPIPGEPCHLEESVVELQWAMELLVSCLKFSWLLCPPIGWRSAHPGKQNPPHKTYHSHSCSRSHWASPRGSLSAAHSIDWHITTEETDIPAASCQKKTLLQSHHKPPCPPPRFVEIAHALWGEESAEYSGPGVQYHSRWPPGTSFVGAPQLGLIICFTAWCLLILPYTDQFVHPVCLPWCFNRPFLLHLCTVDNFILGI